MDELMTNESIKSFVESIQGLKDITDEDLDDEMMEQMLAAIENGFSPAVIQQSVNQIIQNLEAQGQTREEAAAASKALKEFISELLYGDEVPVGNKKVLFDKIMEKMYLMFDEAVDKYHNYSIELPMTLAEGAVEPTYAHPTDAAADLYALEDTDMNAHTYGNKIRTGVNIQLPEGWLALILPRSSIGAKTPYRLSNSVGLIDSGYRGELGVLYDNTSDDNLYIQKGTRIAQLLVMPSYRFKAKVVDSLEDSDRGEGGFGSTGV